jgi:hypothetical protein
MFTEEHMPINSLHSDTVEQLMTLLDHASGWMSHNCAYGILYGQRRHVDLFGDSELVFHGLATITDIEDTVTRDESRPDIHRVTISYVDTTPGSPPDGVPDEGFYALAVEIEDPDAEDRRSLHYVKQDNEDGDTIVLMVSAVPPRRPF